MLRNWNNLTRKSIEIAKNVQKSIFRSNKISKHFRHLKNDRKHPLPRTIFL